MKNEFENLCEDLHSRIILPIEDALQKSKLSNEISEVHITFKVFDNI